MRTEYCYTALAMAVDMAMHDNPEAKARYREVWGVEWVPLAERYGDDGFGALGAEVDQAFASITAMDVPGPYDTVVGSGRGRR